MSETPAAHLARLKCAHREWLFGFAEHSRRYYAIPPLTTRIAQNALTAPTVPELEALVVDAEKGRDHRLRFDPAASGMPEVSTGDE